MDILNSSNLPVSFTLTETHLLVSLADGRIVGAPLNWWPWLPEAIANQADYIIGTDSILWPDYDGVDMEVLLLGLPDHDYVSVQEMAEQAGVEPFTINRILLADQDKPISERRIRGAFKIGNGRRGEWKIPRDVAETWHRDSRGRLKQQETN